MYVYITSGDNFVSFALFFIVVFSFVVRAVLLAPYSMSGILTGVTYRLGDPGVQKMLDEWKQFFPLARRHRKRSRTNSNSSSTDGDDNGAGGENTREAGDLCTGESSGDCAHEEETLPPVVEVLLGKSFPTE